MQEAILIGRTESPRRESDAQFHHLLHVIPAAAYTTDAEGLITDFNHRAAELWKREPTRNDPIDRY